MSGTKAAKNVMTASGTTSGTPMMTSAMAIRTASTNPTIAIPRT